MSFFLDNLKEGFWSNPLPPFCTMSRFSPFLSFDGAPYLDVVFCRCRKICRGRNSNRNSYFRDKISVLIFLTNFIKTSVRKYIRRRVKEQQYGKASRMRYYPASFYTTILDYFVDDPNYCKVILSRFALSEVSLFPLKASLLQWQLSLLRRRMRHSHDNFPFK